MSFPSIPNGSCYFFIYFYSNMMYDSAILKNLKITRGPYRSKTVPYEVYEDGEHGCRRSYDYV
jgi:hypothetical protein